MICDADLVFISCVAKWPGSVHDARVLCESAMFDEFKNNARNPWMACCWATVDTCSVTGCLRHLPTLQHVRRGTTMPDACLLDLL